MIEVTPNAFKIVLPNMNAARENAPSKMTEQMKKVMEHIAENGKISEAEVRALLGIKKTRAFDLMKQMCDLGLVRSEGRGAAKEYKAK